MRASLTLPTALALALVGLTACTSQEPGATSSAKPTSPTVSPPAPSASPTSSAAPGKPASFRVVRTLDSASAAPATDQQRTRRYTTKRSTSDGKRFGIRDLTATGSVVTSLAVKATVKDGEIRLPEQQMGIADAQASFTPFPEASGKKCARSPRQAEGATERNGVVAWRETASTNLYNVDWCVFAYNPASKSTVLLGDSASVSNRIPPPAGGAVVAIGSKKAYWETAYPLTDAETTPISTKIMTNTLDGRAGLTTAVDKAKLPRVLGDDLYYVRSNDIDAAFAPDHFEIRKRDTTGHDTQIVSGPLTKDQRLSTLSVSTGHISWVISNPNHTSLLHILDVKTNTAVTIKLGHGGPSTMDLASTDTLVAWGNGSASGDPGEYVYDLATGKLWKLGSQGGYSAILAKGKYVAWAHIEKSGSDGRAVYDVAEWKG
ncbi:hypothetical protein ACFQ67_21030 [Streptomyces sp. NPDC056488]|uniref:hypothetical protein n=1 Tax=Streptomyces sp. NPDC056488 TaxID=3345836 RepID=UPI0036870803